MNIDKIVKNMQDFQKEFHKEFKDRETFWKHFYIKLDKEIHEELEQMLNWWKEEMKLYKQDVIQVVKEVFKALEKSGFEAIEIEVKEKTT